MLSGTYHTQNYATTGGFLCDTFWSPTTYNMVYNAKQVYDAKQIYTVQRILRYFPWNPKEIKQYFK